ncbi:toll/interleukin-1 receptor-like protein [Rutidosis leptorrhynchoides]|uniref:toll/interleukin-1 receptor-like protein n=1 Tax=Rutidosis leptorrhynchoides TaxID=125765 RepID=UPI003A9A63AD
MSSASNSTVHNSFKYDLFLSFRGEDTRKNFVDHLYCALEQSGLRTYKDDERIEKGKRISDELITSIQDSKFHIIVFSKNYASSSWCLDELVYIMEWRKIIQEKTVYPIFYDVKPSDVRKQSGLVGKAFAKLKNEETASNWKDALKEASELAGWELKSVANGHEAKLIQQIIDKISRELSYTSSSTDITEMGMIEGLGAMDLKDNNNNNDRVLGMMKGLGDRATTNLINTVVDHISFEFGKELSKASLSGLKSLHKLADGRVKSRLWVPLKSATKSATKYLKLRGLSSVRKSATKAPQ